MDAQLEFNSNNGTDFNTFISNVKYLIYIPAFNCEKTIESVIESIPRINNSAIIVFDNASTDQTPKIVQSIIKSGSKTNAPLALLCSSFNLGYAGSQKKTFNIFRDYLNLEWIILLHGDSQYNPLLLEKFQPFFESDLDIVYGYRSKFEKGEETPLLTYFAIKILSLLESIVCGHYQKEWHSGFVMYRCRFLRLINLEKITNTRHIEGQMLFIAHILGAKVNSIPIYKKYKNLIAFAGSERREYIFDVFKLMFEFRKITISDIRRNL